MEVLPPECLLEIFEKIPCFSRLRLSHVCRLWREICRRYVSVDISIGLPYELRQIKFSRINELHLHGQCAFKENDGVIKYIRSLRFSECSIIPTRLPKTFRHLYIQFSACAFPPSFGKLGQVVDITLECCRMCSLPDISGLTSLERLVFIRCPNLVILPDTIGSLPSLKHLAISACNSLYTLPDSIGDLQSLITLQVVWCLRFIILPESIRSILTLTTLTISSCLSIHLLPKLPENLITVVINDCAWLYDIGVLPSKIERLCITRCCNLQNFDQIFELTKLEVLNMSHLSIMVIPGSIENLKNLRELNLSDTNLTYISESLGRLKKLERLGLRNCIRLHSLPTSVKHLNSLKILDLIGCSYLAIACTIIPQNTYIQI